MSVWGPSGWKKSLRKHCEALAIPLDLHATGAMLLKLKKFVNASMCSDEISYRGEKPVRFSRAKFSERQGAQELACAREGV